ncbi:ABC-F family ATP-binding cassette domain-containing protein [Sphingoaurantiacus capsulatus]|uniref:ABC-F family ATP-binding cassette domain-containing protein n=1 Tax=Sphingoaurantiacus capsulatus TaxID=1771310 RepID=A0ABV7XAF0_9SPHN
MPAITLSNLSWATPDGRRVLSNLDLSFTSERTGLVGRNGTGKTSLLRLMSGELTPLSGRVTIDGTIGVLRQELLPDPDATIADLFGVREALAVLDRAARGDARVDELSDADWTLEARMEAALASVGLAAEPDAPLVQLSGGQRTRAALAALTFAAPDFLLLDEPTNNLDREGRAAVAELLAGWGAGAIVVSHDRELLEAMDAIVELTSLGATRYGGGWSAYRERKALELAAAEHDLAVADRRVAEIDRRAQAMVERKARKDSVGAKKGARGDMPRILIGAMKRRAEETGGAGARLADKQRDEASSAAAAARERVEVLQPFKVVQPPTGLLPGKIVLRADGLTFGHVSGEPLIDDFSFDLTGPERVAITGANGSGKSTLLDLIAGRLAPWEGSVRVGVPFAMFDQEVALLDRDATILDNFRRLNPVADENACRAALARYMFRADAALQTVATLSGGQLLRAGLACVLGGPTPPQLLLLDEPTNHLDIDSIETVEAGLRGYDGALLVVSHDAAFLDAIGVTRRIAIG